MVCGVRCALGGVSCAGNVCVDIVVSRREKYFNGVEQASLANTLTTPQSTHAVSYHFNFYYRYYYFYC